MQNYKLCILILTLYFSYSPAFAYLDPGTGGSLLQIIIAFIAAAGASIGLYWQRFKAFIKKIFSKEKKDNKE